MRIAAWGSGSGRRTWPRREQWLAQPPVASARDSFCTAFPAGLALVEGGREATHHPGPGPCKWPTSPQGKRLPRLLTRRRATRRPASPKCRLPRFRRSQTLHQRTMGGSNSRGLPPNTLANRCRELPATAGPRTGSPRSPPGSAPRSRAQLRRESPTPRRTRRRPHREPPTR